MPRFNYEALDLRGKPVQGSLTVTTITEAATVLRSRDLVITKLHEQEPADEHSTASGAPEEDILMRLGVVKQNDIVIIFKQMAAMLRSGITLVVTLSLLAEQTKKRKLKHILSVLQREVEAGRVLSEAMSIFPRTFPKYITSMIQVGEATGLLEESLDSVISLMEERIHISRRVITSLIYPTIVLLAVPAAAVFLIWYVFPRMMPFITSMGGKLSWNVELMIALAEGFPIYAPKILLGIGIAAGIIVICYLLPTTRYYIDLFKLHLPLFGTVFQYALVYHFTRVLSVLLESGVPILDALRIIDESTGNHAAKRVIQEMAERVLRGDDLSAPLLKATNVFPPVVGTSVRVGEETGSIDSSLSMIADMFRDLLETQLNRLVAFVEPALILFLGALVGFVASTMVSAIISSYGRLAA